jgi:hypothetical protein
VAFDIFDLSKESSFWVPARTIDNDIVSGLPLAIWIHKNDLSEAEHGLHRVVFYFQGDGAHPTNVRRVEHRFGVDAVRRVVVCDHLIQLMPVQQGDLPNEASRGTKGASS